MPTISKETINRLVKDVKTIIKTPLIDNGIHYVHDDADMLKGYALIIGPSDTPYFGGFYFFKFDYPTDYPHSPPKVTYCTNGENVRFNPNLYKTGKVCISLLNTWRGEQWTSCQSISTVLLTLCTLLSTNPLLNEPGISLKHPDLNNYNEIIFYSNINVAICDIIQKKANIYMSFFDLFYPQAQEAFLKNYDKILELLKNKHHEKPQVINTTIYEMAININYKTLINKLKKTNDLITAPK